MCEEERSFTRNQKPRYVRRLEFGRVVLNLDTYHDRNTECAHGQLAINDGQIVDIPCIDKHEFIRKWIETHENEIGFSLRASATEDIEDLNKTDSQIVKNTAVSPILSNRFKKSRFRNLACADGQKSSQHVYIESGSGSDLAVDKCTCNCSPRNSKSANASCRPPLQPWPDNSQKSPILGKRKLKRKSKNRTVNIAQNHIVDKALMTSSTMSDTNGNLLEAEPPGKKFKRVITEYLPYSESQIHCKNDSTIGQLESQIELQIDDSSDIEMVETCIKDESQKEYPKNSLFIPDIFSKACLLSEETSDTTNSLLIIDTETQDVTFKLQPSSDSRRPEKAIETSAPLTFENCTVKPDTFGLQPNYSASSSSVHPTELTQHLTMSTQTLSPRVQEESAGTLCIIDSGKKKKRPKKGSLVGRLQSLINSEISFARMWRHRMKRTIYESLGCSQFSTILVKKSIFRFDKQFLYGFVLSDKFGLLPVKNSSIFDNPHSKNRGRTILIVLTPEIVGKIEIKLASVVHIAPPWRVIDDENLVLDVTNINVAPELQQFDMSMQNEESSANRENIVAMYTCECELVQDDWNLSQSHGGLCDKRLNEPDALETIIRD